MIKPLVRSRRAAQSTRHSHESNRARRRQRIARAIVATAAFATMELGAHYTALAVSASGSITWVGSSDSWYNPAAWNTGVLPAITDDTWIDNGSTVTIADPNQTATGNIVAAGSSNGFSGAIAMQAGTLTLGTDLRIGGNSGVPGVPGTPPVAGQGGGLGTLTQSGGVINVGGALNVGVGGTTTTFGGSSGYYALSGGTLNNGTTSGNFITVGNGSLVIGSVVQTGGTVNDRGQMIIGRNAGAGTWQLQSGDVNLKNDLALGNIGQGTFVQSGGNVTITAAPVDDSGTTTFSSANLNMGMSNAASVGTYLMSGGNLALSLGGGTTFSASVRGSVFVGNTGTGFFQQTGGNVDISQGMLQLARNNGTGQFIISGDASKLTAGSVVFGNGDTTIRNGAATFTQNGGSVSITGDINLGNTISGAFNVNGGSLSANALVDGSGGSATQIKTINVSGGTVTVNNINFGSQNANPTRQFNLSGGTVTTGDFNTGRNGLFNITGGTFSHTGTGTLMSTGTFETSIDLNLTSTIAFGASTARVDANTLTFSGPVITTSALTLTKTGPGTLTISGPQTHAAPNAGVTPAITNTAGVLNVDSDGGTNLSINANGGTTNFGVTQHLAAVTVGNGGFAQVRSGANKVLSVASLSIDGGTSPTARLDLHDNDMIVNYASTDASPLPTIQAQIKSAYNGGSWTGNGITSTEAASGFNGHPTALGYAESSAVFPGGGGGTFSGESVDNDAVLVRYTLAGDSDLSGKVDLTDFTFLAANFNRQGDATWINGDFNYDGNVDLTDFTFLAGNFNQQLPAGGASPGALGAPVPEPVSASLLALSCLATSWRPRRRRREI